MKPIEKTEMYDVAMNSIRMSYSEGDMLCALQTDVQFRRCMRIEPKILNDYGAMEVVTERLAHDLVMDVLMKCGITFKDLKLLAIAKELAAEDDEVTNAC